MRRILTVLAVTLLGLPASAAASTLTVAVSTHTVYIPAASGQPGHAVWVVWADEHAVANVRVTGSPRQIDEVQWTLVRRDRRTPVAVVTTLTARLDFGLLAVGDYRLTADAGGLTSSFEFSVRTGAEPELRSEYLRERAAATRDYRELRRLELERFAVNPSRLDALLNIIDRSLQEGSASEMRDDFDRAIHAYESRRPTFATETLPKIDAYIRDLRVARDALPDYIRHRNEWSMVRDPCTSVYTIVGRGDRKVIRVLHAQQ